MDVKQIYEIVNDVTKEVLGESVVVQEDLSNLVDIGDAIVNANAYDNYTKKLIDRIGKVVFVIRKYTGSAPSVLMDSWEYGNVLQKIRAELPDAVENESWELEDGASYDQDVFHKPNVSAKFYSKRTTFEVDISITDEQLKSAFTTAEQLNSFISMIYNEVDKKLTVSTDGLIMRTINNMIGETIHDDYGSASLSSKTGVKAVNLLYKYNTEMGLSGGNALTKDKAYTDAKFLRYCALEMKKYSARLKKLNRLFNIGGTAKFTPSDYLHFVMLADFKAGVDVYLQSDVWHNELTKMPIAEEVSCWQGIGTDFGIESVSKINVKTASGDVIETDGILAVMFDRDALGVSCYRRNVTSHRNDKAEFTNYFYKQFAGYFNDFDENFVVFFIQ